MKSYVVTIQIKPLQQNFQTILSVDEILWYDHSNETSSMVPQVLSLMLFKAFSVLTFELVDEILS